MKIHAGDVKVSFKCPTYDVPVNTHLVYDIAGRCSETVEVETGIGMFPEFYPSEHHLEVYCTACGQYHAIEGGK